MTQLDATRFQEPQLDDGSLDVEAGAGLDAERPVVEESQNGSPPASEPGLNSQNTSAEAAKLQSNLKARRRTKTGCLSEFLPKCSVSPS